MSCTLLKMPLLAGKPLIIGGTSNRGVVTSTSYEAQRYGVTFAMPTPDFTASTFRCFFKA
ncbi:MAG: hypothetical protein AAFX57_06450 [Bacteroidota bacterium]